MGKFSGYVLMSDIDGTLVHNKIIPQRNIDAIQHFVEEGGRFSVATGRSWPITTDIVEQLPVNFPSVIFNGGALYDFQKRETLFKVLLPEEVKQIVPKIMERFPSAGVMVVTEMHYNAITRGREALERITSNPNVFHEVDSLGELMDLPWYKVLFIGEPEENRILEEFLNSQNYPGVRYVYADASMLEMLPECSSKGYALEKLIELCPFDTEKLLSIGDYDNDIEMIRLAKIGATVPEAPQAVRDAADIILCPCTEGAVADLIEYAEKTLLL